MRVGANAIWVAVGEIVAVAPGPLPALLSGVRGISAAVGGVVGGSASITMGVIEADGVTGSGVNVTGRTLMRTGVALGSGVKVLTRVSADGVRLSVTEAAVVTDGVTVSDSGGAVGVADAVGVRLTVTERVAVAVTGGVVVEVGGGVRVKVAVDVTVCVAVAESV
jgi:hypothetical protein